MKRVPLEQLKGTLRPGDYVGAQAEELHEVTAIEPDGFTYKTCYANHIRIFWTGHQLYQGQMIESVPRSYFWLPGELLDSTEIARIKSERRKERGK